MKTYENESMFVNNFAKDAKESLRNGQNFEAVVNDVSVIISNMDNNNASKVTIYTGSVDGVEFNGSITALKKRLNVTYTKDYNRSGEGTKVVIKSDEELSKTAETAANRIKQAVETLTKYGHKYGLRLDQLTMGEWSYDTPSGRTLNVTVEQYILACLYEQRSNAIKEQERIEAEKKAAAKRKAEETAAKIASEKAKLEKQLAELQAKLAKMQ